MRTLESYVCGAWTQGTESPRPLHDPCTGEVVAECSTRGIDMRAVLEHARTAGGPRLREMTYAERGAMLSAAAKVVHERREELIELAIVNGGNTRKDAKFDLDGATATLQAYGSFGKSLGDVRVLTDGEGQQLGRTARFWGEHVWLPREGAAVHINAFNFPAWGLAEKAACAWLAGMPVVSKPATATAMVTEAIVRILIESEVLPEGALQLLCGSAGDLLNYMGPQDVLAFTGSAATGYKLRSNENLLRNSVRVNIEADSLNSAVLGPDVSPGSETWNLFLKDVITEMTQKAGQKCTAVRRIFVPESIADNVQAELIDRLSAVQTGNPRLREVMVSPLATADQQADVRAGIAKLCEEAELVYGADGSHEFTDIDADKAYVVGPALLRIADADAASIVHDHEVFGPVATIIPTRDADHAVELVAKGLGSLVASVYSDDREFIKTMVLGLGPWHGRLYIGSARVAEQTLGSGTVLPASVHGGPGRAGGGEELGMDRGMHLYQQRVALQGDRAILQRLF